MIRKLGSIVMLLFLLALCVKGYATYLAFQFVEQVKHEQQSNMSLSYSWVSVDYKGQVHFQGVAVMPFGLKRPINIDEVSLSFDGVLSLINELPELQSGYLPSKATVSIKGLNMPLRGRGLDEWLALFAGEKIHVPLGLHACGKRSRVDFDALQAMGIDEIRATAQISYLEGGAGDSITFELDIDQVGVFDVQSTWTAGTLEKALRKRDLAKLGLDSVLFKHQDKGYYRRLANLCAQDQASGQAAFAELSAQTWRVAMANIGILLNENVQQIYQDNLQQGGVLVLNAEFPKTFEFSDMSVILDKDFVSLTDLKVVLNGELRDELFVFIDGAFYRPKAILAAKDLPDKDAVVLPTPMDFYKTDYAQLPDYLQSKVNIELLDGKSYQGMLKSANERQIEVTSLIAGGSVDYSIKVEKIDYVQVWRLPVSGQE